MKVPCTDFPMTFLNKMTPIHKNSQSYSRKLSRLSSKQISACPSSTKITDR